jgi:hypothetical protein
MIGLKLENNRSMKKQFIFNYPNLLLSIITLLSLFFGIFYFRNGIYDIDFFTLLILFGMAWFAVLADKMLKLKLGNLIVSLYYIFLILTLFFGRILHFYNSSWYRNFTHFLGGIFSSLIGIYLIIRLDNIGFMKFSIVLTYSLFFSGFTTSLWSITSGVVADLSGNPQTDINMRIAMGLIGASFFAILLILDYLLYHNRYLERLIRKL